jgi:hypothetical protein
MLGDEECEGNDADDLQAHLESDLRDEAGYCHILQAHQRVRAGIHFVHLNVRALCSRLVPLSLKRMTKSITALSAREARLLFLYLPGYEA